MIIISAISIDSMCDVKAFTGYTITCPIAPLLVNALVNASLYG